MPCNEKISFKTDQLESCLKSMLINVQHNCDANAMFISLSDFCGGYVMRKVPTV